LGFSAIFTKLLLDSLFNKCSHEILQNFVVLTDGKRRQTGDTPRHRFPFLSQEGKEKKCDVEMIERDIQTHQK
jgi:hypothetical protein